MIKIKTNNGVIVLGGHVQGYGIVRTLGENKIYSVVVDKSKHNIARHSKYCIGFYEVNYDNMIELLINIGKQGKYNKWLLIPTDDYYVRLLSQNKNELNKHFIVPVDDWPIINKFFNKKNSYPLAQKAGVPIPQTFYPESFDDIIKLSSEITFPCIIKPAIMLDFYICFKRKVIVCKDIDELKTNYLSTTSLIGSQFLMIQEIIPGSSENQYSVGLFFDRSKALNHLVVRRKRQHPVDFGNATTFAETVDLPILVEYAHKILTAANYSGLCEVEFKFDGRDQQYKFLEVNPRTWKWHTIAERADVPFLMSLYNFHTGVGPITTNTQFKYAVWQDLVTDIPIQLIYLREGFYKKTISKHKSHAVFSMFDLKPFLFQILYIPLHILYR